MAVEQVEAFYRKVMESEELKQEVMKITGTPKSVGEKVTAIAKENGFDVTLEDFEKYYYDQAEMEPGEMEQIAAGKKSVGCSGGDPNCVKVCDEICGSFLGHYLGTQR